MYRPMYTYMITNMIKYLFPKMSTEFKFQEVVNPKYNSAISIHV